MLDDETRIRLIIKKILTEYKKGLLNKEKILVVFPYPWKNSYYLLEEYLSNENYDLSALVSDDVPEKNFADLRENDLFSEVISYKDVDKINDKFKKVLFGSLSVDDIVDITLLKSNSIETNIIKKSFKAGISIAIWINGLEKLTEKEPDYYKEKLKGYYEEILKMNIKILDNKAVRKWAIH
ncbi:hypothetical protein [Anaerococcus sp. AGMB09787]|uniref:hypothetical protein n=1 Tax=Anaerococcus sp. AGMB09787 TaxID=2922869 RepID=UPI001FAF42D5|nr:hypothetical protein [Anaerococcus sp. AGMB09787]